MSAGTEPRARARKRALEILHAADVSGAAPDLEDRLDRFTRSLVDGVQAHRETLDRALEDAAEHWTVERMPVVDRNILRIAAFELFHTDTPTGAIVDQAVRLANLLSTEGSGRFVNGILGRLAREHPRA
ncbi:MAG TPA: transcription antitermination factor NusB [Actinomycetota bacterium]